MCMMKIINNIVCGMLFSAAVISTTAASATEISATDPASPDKLKSLQLFYDEVEEDAGIQQMRYLINSQYVRIDNGTEKSDFILFNVKTKTVYSVNHQDQTILKIKNNQWQLPEFAFTVTREEQLVKDAPEIFNKPVYRYQVKAGEQLCTQVFLIKDVFSENMKILHQYQQVISGQQVAMLNNTPVDMQTPCFLVDQVYHKGEYYKSGLPVQITYDRGYAKLLNDFSEAEFAQALFVLPVGYTEYMAVTQ